MNARRRASLIANICYVPAPPRHERIRTEIRRDWRTFKMIVRQCLAAPSLMSWFVVGVVIAAGVIAALIIQ
jgi:hypothetical protein